MWSEKTGGKPVGWVPKEYIPKEEPTPASEAQVNNTSSESIVSSHQSVLVPSRSEAEVNAGSESMPSAQPTPTLVPTSEVPPTQESVPTTSSSQIGCHDQTHQNNQHQQQDENQVAMSSDSPQHDTHEEGLETATEDAPLTEDAKATNGEDATVIGMPVVDGQTLII